MITRLHGVTPLPPPPFVGSPGGMFGHIEIGQRFRVLVAGHGPGFAMERTPLPRPDLHVSKGANRAPAPKPRRNWHAVSKRILPLRKDFRMICWVPGTFQKSIMSTDAFEN